MLGCVSIQRPVSWDVADVDGWFAKRTQFRRPRENEANSALSNLVSLAAHGVISLTEPVVHIPEKGFGSPGRTLELDGEPLPRIRQLGHGTSQTTLRHVQLLQIHVRLPQGVER